jgi:Icc-related predicted phosphoesterase
MAFVLPRGPALAEKWAKIPSDTDILITHGPPEGILDRTVHRDRETGAKKVYLAGCGDLTQRVAAISPKIHLFGHIHEGYGMKTVGETVYINAALNTKNYECTNKPVIVDVTFN